MDLAIEQIINSPKQMCDLHDKFLVYFLNVIDTGLDYPLLKGTTT